MKRSTSAAALTLALALPQPIWAQDGEADCEQLIAAYEAENGEGSAEGADPATAGDEATAACLAQSADVEAEAAPSGETPAEDLPAEAAQSAPAGAEATGTEESAAEETVEETATDEAATGDAPAETPAADEQTSEAATPESTAAEDTATEEPTPDATAAEEAAPASAPAEAEGGTLPTGDGGDAGAEATETQQLEEALQAEEEAESAEEPAPTSEADAASEDAMATGETAEEDSEQSAGQTQADGDTSAEEATSDQEMTDESGTSEEADPAAGDASAEETETTDGDVTAESEAEIEVTQEDTEESTEAANTQVDTAAASAGAEATGEAETETTVITEENSRSSDEEFSNSTTATSSRNEESDDDDDNDRLGEFAKIAAGVAGGVLLNELLGQNDEVVENTGDRVVVQRQNGEYYVLKDDDTLLRQPGTELRTQSFSDGSSRTIATRDDGTEVITIRAANGQVLRRTRVLSDGREIVLFDDTAEVQPVNLSDLPEPQRDVISIEDLEEESLRRALAEESEAEDRIGRTFSLAQVRNIRAVRALVPTIELENVTFDTGSSAIRPSEAEELAAIGRAMRDMIASNPDEVFLIEGHTDAVGSASMNLALSDRRAESVALALTEYFDVPPENMIVQGYGESDLKVQTGIAERENRRAAVRRITPLITASR
ncbi:OmpA family protein [Allosediminivita pacifica]|uniref:OmpA family protein n=1 Tax=Allosediminivita pacifica TaxID=1267769 RepID=UPI0011B1C9CF|nr:OmpA family protein [Allosediminivita pacifica]